MKSAVRGRFHPANDREIEAYLCGELEGDARARLEQQVERDTALHAYVAERRRAAAGFARLRPLSTEVREQRAPIGKDRYRRRGAALGLSVLSLAAAASLAGVWWSQAATLTPLAMGPDPQVAKQDRVRVKGVGLAVALYVKRGDEVFQHEPRTALRPGDRLRLRVDAEDGGFLTVLSRDRAGVITPYYDRVPVSPGRFLVPDSLLLDATFEAERWLVILDSEGRSAESYARAWREGRAPAAPHRVFELARSAP